MFKRSCLLVVAAVVIAGIGQALLFLALTAPEERSTEDAPRIPETSLVKEIQEISRLATAEATLQTIVCVEEENVWRSLRIGNTKMLYVGVGTVMAGFDLAELESGDIQVTDVSLYVRLPQPRVLDAKIDVIRSYVFAVERSALFAPEGMALQRRAEIQALGRIVTMAVETGLLDTARDQIVKLVSELASAHGLPEVTIEFVFDSSSDLKGLNG